MPFEKITRVAGRVVPVPGDDIDTDRIIPARFMKCVTFDGLGEYLFYDTRRDEEGHLKPHPLNESRFAGATILLSGANFGCGSSREHAPQAVLRAGFKAVIAEGYAEIFFGNSTQLGLVCVTAAKADLQRLRQAVDGDPTLEVTIDLPAKTIAFGGQSIPCDIREGARSVLMSGRWDPLQDLITGMEQVEAVATRLPYMQPASA